MVLQAQMTEMIPRATLAKAEAERHEAETKLEASQVELAESRKQIETLQFSLEELAKQVDGSPNLKLLSTLEIPFSTSSSCSDVSFKVQCFKHA